jgi:replicative DNA helicase
MGDKKSLQTLVFSPQEIAALSMKVVAERRDNPGSGIRLGLDSVDRDLLPLRPTELITVLGRPSNFKTGLMLHVARYESALIQALRLANVPGADKEYVVYVTWEVAVEESGMIDLAHDTGIDVAAMAQGEIVAQEWDALMGAALKRAVKPLWVIGHSIEHRKARPRLTMTEVMACLRELEDEMGYHPRLVILDYLQRIPPATGSRSVERRIYVAENVDMSKDLALEMGTTVILGCQAKREVEEAKSGLHIPGLADGMETSNIEHASDRMLGLWMPKTTRRGELIAEFDLVADDHLLLLNIAKQRFGVAGKTYPLWVDAGKNIVQDLLTRTINEELAMADFPQELE